MASATIEPPRGSRCGVYVCSSLISTHTLRAPTAYGALRGGTGGAGAGKGQTGAGGCRGGIVRTAVAT
eukprot:5320929-Prymnesium_polylepis.1